MVDIPVSEAVTIQALLLIFSEWGCGSLTKTALNDDKGSNRGVLMSFFSNKMHASGENVARYEEIVLNGMLIFASDISPPRVAL